MRLLFASVVDPRQQKGGAWTVTRGILRSIDTAETTVLALPEVPTPLRPWRRLRCLGASLLGGPPAKIGYACRRSFLRLFLESWRSKHFDGLVINGTDLLWLLDHVPAGVPSGAIVHNLEHEVQLAQIQALPAPLRLRLLTDDAMRLRDFQAQRLARCRASLYLSPVEFASAPHPERSFFALPAFGETVPSVQRNPSNTYRVCMLANFDWWPNRHGAEWFLREVWPGVSDGTMELRFFGAGSERFPRGIGQGGVPDLNAVWDNTDLLISPVHLGGGISVKTVEALYHRVPLLATPFAVRGLGVEHEPGVYTGATAAEWISILRGKPSGAAPSVELASRFTFPASRGAISAFVNTVLRGL